MLAAVVTFFVHEQVNRINSAMLVFDAGGLGLFAVAGTLKALAYGLGPVQAVALGVMTAIGGGIVRDVLANEMPTILRPESELYTIPACVGSTLVAIDWLVSGGDPLFAVLAALVGFALRLAALHYGWRTPCAWPTVAPTCSVAACGRMRRQASRWLDARRLRHPAPEPARRPRPASAGAGGRPR